MRILHSGGSTALSRTIAAPASSKSVPLPRVTIVAQGAPRAARRRRTVLRDHGPSEVGMCVSVLGIILLFGLVLLQALDAVPLRMVALYLLPSVGMALGPWVVAFIDCMDSVNRSKSIAARAPMQRAVELETRGVCIDIKA